MPYRVQGDFDASAAPSDSGEPLRPISGAARVTGMVGLACGLAFVAALVGEAREPATLRWTFLDPAANLADIGLDDASRQFAGSWVLETHAQATGARALANHAIEDDVPPAILVVRSLQTRDVAAVTRCKTSPEPRAQQCGVVLRLRDSGNYEVARLDTEGKTVVLGWVIDGRERLLGRAPADAAPGTWHELGVTASAGVTRVTWNGRTVIEVPEALPPLHGRVGLWVPAGGTAWFDELAVAALPDSARALEVLPLLARPGS